MQQAGVQTLLIRHHLGYRIDEEIERLGAGRATKESIPLSSLTAGGARVARAGKHWHHQVDQ